MHRRERLFDVDVWGECQINQKWFELPLHGLPTENMLYKLPTFYFFFIFFHFICYLWENILYALGLATFSSEIQINIFYNSFDWLVSGYFLENITWTYKNMRRIGKIINFYGRSGLMNSKHIFIERKVVVHVLWLFVRRVNLHWIVATLLILYILNTHLIPIVIFVNWNDPPGLRS